MTEQDHGFDDEYREIIGRSPILEKLLSDTIETDEEQWATELTDETLKVIEHLEEHFGENFLELNVYPLVQGSEIKRVFPDDAERMSSFGFVEVAIGIGYQLSDPQAAIKVMGEVLVRLGEIEAIQVYDDEAERVKVGEEVWSWILDGAFLKYLETGIFPESLEESVEDPNEDKEIGDEPKPALKPETPADKKRLDIFEDFFNKNNKLDNL